MDSVGELEKKVEQMKTDSENVAEELIRLRVQYQSLRARHEVLTQQVGQYVQRSRDQEHLLCDTQREILQLKEVLEIEERSNEFVRCEVMTTPSTSLSQSLAMNPFDTSSLPLLRNALLQVDPPPAAGQLTESSSSLLFPCSDLHSMSDTRPILVSQVPSSGTTPTSSLAPFYGYISDALLRSLPSPLFSVDNPAGPRSGLSYAQPVMIAPSLSPPATTFSPRLRSSTLDAMGREGLMIPHEGPSDFKSFEITTALEGADDPAALSLADLFGDEVELLTEQRNKRSRHE